MATAEFSKFADILSAALSQHLGCMYLYKSVFLPFSDIYSGMELLGHTVVLCFPGGASGKEPACQCMRHKRHGLDPWVEKIPLEEGMATHSSIFAWRIPWKEEPGGLWPIALQRVGHN